MRRNALVLLLAWLVAGCAGPQAPSLLTAPSPAAASGFEGFITQRAVLTARGRQFALNGYLAQNAAGGKRLVITEMFGQVLADVLVKPGGTVYVMQSSRLLRPAWIRRYVAADMQCVFGGAANAACPVRKLSEDHFVVQRRWYKLDLRTVETRAGPQPPELFDEKREAK